LLLQKYEIFGANMQKVLGLDLGSNSIGWAMIVEEEGQWRILGAGSRIIPMGAARTDFEQGQKITKNAGRRLHRGARRLNYRYKMRREKLLRHLEQMGLLPEGISERDPRTRKLTAKAFEIRVEFFQRSGGSESKKLLAKQLYRLRADALIRELTPFELGRVFAHMNQRRGYFSTRELMEEDETEDEKVEERTKKASTKAIEDVIIRRVTDTGERTAKHQPLLEIELEDGRIGTSRIEQFTHLEGKPARITVKEKKNTKKGKQLISAIESEFEFFLNQDTGWRTALRSLDGEMGDLTPGEFFSKMLEENPHYKIRDRVVLRERYIQEFQEIWRKQSLFPAFAQILTEDRRKTIQKEIIYFQRRLKSQRKSIPDCPFEFFLDATKNKVYPRKVASKSSPEYQEYRIWKQICNIKLLDSLEQEVAITEDQKHGLYSLLNKTESATVEDILKSLVGKKATTELHLNYSDKQKFEGNRTRVRIAKSLKAADDARPDLLDDEKRFYQLWQALYSIREPEGCKRVLIRKFALTPGSSKRLSEVIFKREFGSYSRQALIKITAKLKAGKTEWEALQEVYGESCQLQSPDKLLDADEIKPLPRNSLRNPVVEQVVNETLSLVRDILRHPNYGRPHEIRIEFSRELKQNREQRNKAWSRMTDRAKENQKAVEELREHGIANPSLGTMEKYKLWKANCISIYSGKTIGAAEFFNSLTGRGDVYDVDHIIPKARFFDDSIANKVLVERSINKEKGDRTAFEFMRGKDDKAFSDYEDRVKEWRGPQRKYLLMQEVPEDFVTRQLKETQYVTRKVREELHQVCEKVTTTSGGITDFLRHSWKLDDVMKHLLKPRFEALGLCREVNSENGRHFELDGYSKRYDHRHHALDAIIIACTSQAMIQQLNRLNQYYSDSETMKERQGRRFEPPWATLPDDTREMLSKLIVSYKNRERLLTRNLNHYSDSSGGEGRQATFSVRGPLHDEQPYRIIRKPAFVSVRDAFDLLDQVIAEYDPIIYPEHRAMMAQRVEQFQGDVVKARRSISKQPFVDAAGMPLDIIPIWKFRVISRKEIGTGFTQAANIVDDEIRKIVQVRLQRYGNDPKQAFKDLVNDPIWLNKQAGVAIKRVRVEITNRSIENLIALNERNIEKPRKWVAPGDNYAIGFYMPINAGKRIRKAITFIEAVEKATLLKRHSPHKRIEVKNLLPSIEGYELLFVLRKNDTIQDPRSGEFFRVQKFQQNGRIFFSPLSASTPIELKEAKIKEDLLIEDTELAEACFPKAVSRTGELQPV
jgi:CRISPR-associated endonuclease Csn1